MIQIEAHFEDAEAVSTDELAELYQIADWARHRSAGQIVDLLRHTDIIFTARAEGRLVGFARVLTDFTVRAAIFDVIVIAEYQRQGVGTALIGALLDHPRLARVEKFLLNTRDKQAFYRKFGFVTSETECMTLTRKE